MAKEMRIRGHPSVAEMGVGGWGENWSLKSKTFLCLFPGLVVALLFRRGRLENICNETVVKQTKQNKNKKHKKLLPWRRFFFFFFSFRRQTGVRYLLHKSNNKCGTAEWKGKFYTYRQRRMNPSAVDEYTLPLLRGGSFKIKNKKTKWKRARDF